MKPLRELQNNLCRDIQFVLFDIDGTITQDGRLPACAYCALERLQESGRRLIAVTGRPAGWCDMIARFWPVAGVIGENGGFFFRYDHDAKRMFRQYQATATERLAQQSRLMEVFHHIEETVPGVALANDQAYRDCDIAVDFCEDVAPLSLAKAERVRDVFVEAGAHAKISSIHVNAWFGDYDKLTMTKDVFQNVFDCDLDTDATSVLFVGDSPNDEPMFEFITQSVGVANIVEFLPVMSFLPHWVTMLPGGQGFAEIADHLLGTVETTT